MTGWRRRSILRATGLTMGGVGPLSGCLRRVDAGRGDPFDITSWPPRGRGDALRVWTWHHFWASWARPMFEREYGLRDSSGTVYGADVEWMAKLRAGEGSIDVLHTTTNGAIHAIDEGWLGPLPTEVMPAWGNPENRGKVPAYRRNGAVYAITQAPMIYPLAYTPRLRHDPPESWRALWDDRFAGEVMMPNDGVLAGQIGALYTGQAPTDPGDLTAVEEALARQQPLVGGYWEDLATIWQRFYNGAATLAPIVHSRLCLCAQDGAPFAWTVPREGAVWTESVFVVPAAADNPRNGVLFADWAAEKKVQGEVSWDPDWSLHRAHTVPPRVRKAYAEIWDRVRG